MLHAPANKIVGGEHNTEKFHKTNFVYAFNLSRHAY